MMAFKRNTINTRVLNDLKNRSVVGIVFYLIVAFIIVSSDNFYSNNMVLSHSFLIAVVGICLVRFLHLIFFSALDSFHRPLNLLCFRVSVSMTALIWGVGFAIVMALEQEVNPQLLMAISTVGLCSGGVVAFLPDGKLALAYNALIILPSAFLLVALGKNPGMATMIFLFFFYLIFIIRRGNSEYWTSLENEHHLQEKTDILKGISRQDVLTGLYNRRFFDETLNLEWKRASRDQKYLSLVVGDIDYFKKINDTYGHPTGDEFLKFVAGKLKTAFKRESDFVARCGGEEFSIILPDTNSLQAYELAEDVRRVLEFGSIEVDQTVIRATISFGVACVIPSYLDSPDRIVREADEALYKAKSKGRNRVEIADRTLEMDSVKGKPSKHLQTG